MRQLRVIKKYPNRRLYDTYESRYITLSDIRYLVQQEVDFQVLDKRSNRDITCQVLLQLIVEQEQTKQTLFTLSMLNALVRSYDDEPTCELVAGYLEHSLQLFLHYKQPLLDRQPVNFLHRLPESSGEHILTELAHLLETAFQQAISKKR